MRCMPHDYPRLNRSLLNLADQEVKCDISNQKVQLVAQVSDIGIHSISTYGDIMTSALLSIAVLIVYVVLIYLFIDIHFEGRGMKPSDFVFIWLELLFPSKANKIKE